MADLETLKKLALKATPGPWSKGYLCVRQATKPDADGRTPKIASVLGDTEQAQHDASYIAEVNPEAILALIERARGLEARVHELQGMKDKSALHNKLARLERSEEVSKEALRKIYLTIRSVLDIRD